jgi:hypothetical protein
MARLPSEKFLVQLAGCDVILLEDGTERIIARADCADFNAIGRAQKVIYDSELNDEDKAFAHFWFGYYFAFGGS